MSKWFRRTIAGVGLIAGVSAATVVLSSVSWRIVTRTAVDQLIQDINAEIVPEVFRFSDLNSSVPAPVQRYFRAVLKDGQPIVRLARFKQSGTFMVQGSADWRPFHAEEVFVTQPAGYIWDARIRMSPLVNVLVRDGYHRGRGSIHGAVMGLINIAHEQGRAELGAGALQRYLAEAIWFPTALLPSEGVVWTPIDESHALATLMDQGTTVSLEFEFAASGEITGMFTPNRYRIENGRYIAAPWGATCRHYEERGGMRIPIGAEVYWKDGDLIEPYWRGEITSARYEFQ